MYLAQIKLRNFRQFGDGAEALEVTFNGGVTALVGRNDSGKSAVIDAIRYALLNRDQDFIRLQHEDFTGDMAGSHSRSCTRKPGPAERVVPCHARCGRHPAGSPPPQLRSP
jgi:predicted ATP-dependent endonuclease of OLD family